MLPLWLSGSRICLQCRGHRRRGFNSWFGKVHWRRKWQPTPVFLPGESHGQRSLVGYSPWGNRVGHNWAYMQPPLTKLCHSSCLHTLSIFYTSVIGSFNSVLQKRKLRVRTLILTFCKFMQLFSSTGRMKTLNCLPPSTCFIMHPHLYISSGYRSGSDLSVARFTTHHCY